MPSNRFSTLGTAFDATKLQNEQLVSGAALTVSVKGFDFAPDDDPFDYDSVPLTEDEKREVRKLRRQMILGLRSTMIQTGNYLLSIKPYIMKGGDRAWTDWLETLPFSSSSAYNYMNAAQWAAKTPTVGDMAPSAIYKGFSAPAVVKDEITRRLDKGQIPRLDEIEEMIAKHEETARAEKEAARAKKRASSDIVKRDDTKRIAEHAAVEIVACLREHFDDPVIGTLIELIGQTSYGALRGALTASRHPTAHSADRSGSQR